DDDTPSVVDAFGASSGTVVVNEDGTITYTPYADWSGTDTFSYVIDDGHGELATATVTVTVDPMNDAPTIDTTTIIVRKDTPLDIDLRTRASDVETAPDDLTFAVSGAQ